MVMPAQLFTIQVKVRVQGPNSKSKSMCKVKTLNSRTWTWSDSILLCHPPPPPLHKLFSATKHPIQQNSIQDCDKVESNSSFTNQPNILQFCTEKEDGC